MFWVCGFRRGTFTSSVFPKGFTVKGLCGFVRVLWEFQETGSLTETLNLMGPAQLIEGFGWGLTTHL